MSDTEQPEQIKSILDNKKIKSSKVISDEKTDGRKNNGRPRGSMNKATAETKLAKKRFQERVNLNADKLFNAQLNLAMGEKYLMVVRTEGTGKNRKRWTEIVDNPDMIKEYLDDELDDDDEHYYYMTTKPANNMAIDSLLNRSFGKAAEKVEVEGGFFKANKMIIEIVGEDPDDADGAATSPTETESETTTSV